jgi:uncharacterized protein (DUF952 family)
MEGKINLLSDENPLIPGLVYKALPEEAWRAACAAGAYHGVGIDVRDGYVHLSTGMQAPQTLALHFADQAMILLIEFDPADLGADLRYEPSRGGDLFPHLYGPLPTGLARRIWRVGDAGTALTPLTI